MYTKNCYEINSRVKKQCICIFKNQDGELPWWHSGWESACQCRGHGFEPWSGKIPHAAEHLGPWATTTEPARLEPVPHNKRGHDSERPAHRDEEWPPLAATRESPRTKRRPNTAKNKLKKKKSRWDFPDGVVDKNSKLPMQGARVWSLVRELDPTKSLHATTKEPASCN